MNYEEKSQVVAKLMKSNPDETAKLEKHYEELTAANARREKADQERIEHLMDEVARLKGRT
jgi:Tfp pilus assembly major pilin PilA